MFNIYTPIQYYSVFKIPGNTLHILLLTKWITFRIKTPQKTSDNFKRYGRKKNKSIFHDFFHDILLIIILDL